ncbi:hypothetical protein DEU56DRAFT_426235 [Suillus clintonianus]|uniref:uncharacterized protein n=1 Tax=Suillus clintonianus TaxID=1904413 RepID=UPI001B879EFE|nr:uncharacterized protein DEU56DRAFT_426235 [Suillus clintonianus]KAG2153871.1 hypothetical protein DEU56DRAFT_426235 [Suillus clintonianus]
MPSLSDQIDHLTSLSKSIKATADEFPTSDGLFTTAVLDTALGDLIRDIDSSELGLFTLVQPPSHVPTESEARGVISRVEFPGATPLRKPPSRRQEMTKPREYEPEVYAQAALKYLDRYHSIRPMPRARSQVQGLINQLDEARRKIRGLSETLQELTSSNPASGTSPQESNAADEERRIQDLQARLTELRKQKDDILRISKPAPKPKPAPRPARAPSPLTVPKTQEEMFWNTPAASARTLRFTEKLMDEEVDINDVSIMSFTSPVPRPRSVLSSLGLPVDDESLDNEEHDIGQDDSVMPDPPDGEELPDNGDELEVNDGDGEQTVVLKKLPLSLPPNPTPLKSATPPETSLPAISELQSPAVVPPGSARKPKVRMNAEIEKIVVKIWGTVGEIIMPGHPFDPTGSVSGGSKPPRAKETIAHLESLSSQTPSPTSPAASSFSSLAPSMIPGQPTSQQIATCQLLLTLLKQPGFSMSLNKLKEALAEGGGGAGGTRTMYACVAKKLIKIERGGGEQVVKFDV